MAILIGCRVAMRIPQKYREYRYANIQQHFYELKTLCYIRGIKGVPTKLIVSHGMSDFPILLATLML